MIIYLHFTSRKTKTKKQQQKKHTHTQTKLHDRQMPIYRKVPGSIK